MLTSDVPPEKREGWFSQRLREGVQVTISHPKIIETGMDLLSHPSLIFFESGYSLHTIRQASRRSWRIGQRQPVRVFYLHYEETMQSSCLQLMAKKMLVSLAMEGKFNGEGLQSFEEDDDMLTAMARELVTEHRIGESADALWRQLQTEQSRFLPPAPPVANEPEVDSVPSPPATAAAFGAHGAKPCERSEVRDAATAKWKTSPRGVSSCARAVLTVLKGGLVLRPDEAAAANAVTCRSRRSALTSAFPTQRSGLSAASVRG